MKKSKGMQLGAMLAAMLLLSIAFAPAVSAKTGIGTSNLSDPVNVKALIEKLSQAGDKADKLYASLTPEEQAAVLEYLKVTQVTTNVTTTGDSVSTLAGGSRSYQVQRDWKNVLGQTLFSYFQKIDWSYDGSIITSKTRLRWGEVYAPFWSFTGHIGNLEEGGVNQWSYRAWTQGEFKLCISGDIGCTQYKYPWIDMTVYGNGGYSSSSGD